MFLKFKKKQVIKKVPSTKLAHYSTLYYFLALFIFNVIYD